MLPLMEEFHIHLLMVLDDTACHYICSFIPHW